MNMYRTETLIEEAGSLIAEEELACREHVTAAVIVSAERFRRAILAMEETLPRSRDASETGARLQMGLRELTIRVDRVLLQFHTKSASVGVRRRRAHLLPVD